MRKLVLAMNVTLDGFADHTVMIADEELLEFFSSLLDDTGIELFGRVTYQLMDPYWPDVSRQRTDSKSTLDFADKFNSIPKIVFSSTLEKAEWNNTTLVRENALEHVARLKEMRGKNLFIGGIKLAGSLMGHGLVDEYWLLVHPVVVGKGRRLFEGLSRKVNLKLIETKALKSGVVAFHYRAQSKVVDSESGKR